MVGTHLQKKNNVFDVFERKSIGVAWKHIIQDDWDVWWVEIFHLVLSCAIIAELYNVAIYGFSCDLSISCSDEKSDCIETQRRLLGSWTLTVVMINFLQSKLNLPWSLAKWLVNGGRETLLTSSGSWSCWSWLTSTTNLDCTTDPGPGQQEHDRSCCWSRGNCSALSPLIGAHRSTD